MSKKLKDYYAQELHAINNLAKDFAKKYSSIAGKLGMAEHEVADPHIERLLEGMAFLNARIQKQLDDEIPNSIKALCSVLYPHYQKPVPSMGIIQFPAHDNQDYGIKVERGTTLAMGNSESKNCYFKSIYPTTVWPLEVKAASFISPSELKVEINCTNKNMAIGDLKIDKLRFFLHGEGSVTNFLYGLITAKAAGFTVKSGEDVITTLSDDYISNVGFSKEESLFLSDGVDYSPSQLLSEYCVFPNKFLFFELCNLQCENFKTIKNNFSIIFSLKESISLLKQSISGDNFKLGCVPIVNLFSQLAEPINLEADSSEYLLTANSRVDVGEQNIYDVKRVTAVSPYNEKIHYKPLFGLTHHESDSENYWQIYDRDGDSHIALVHQDSHILAQQDWTLCVDVRCTNANLPRDLYFKKNISQLKVLNGPAIEENLTWLIAPTSYLTEVMTQELHWKLVSHLCGQKLGVGVKDGSVLRETLSLYNVANNSEVQRYFESINAIEVRRTQACLPEDPIDLFCQGLEIIVDLKTEEEQPHEILIFGNILERFIATSSTLNHFTKLIFTTDQFHKTLYAWPARIGLRSLI